MEIIEHLFRGFPELWGGGVAHSVMILALVITLGLSLGKLRYKGVSLGMAWILFVGLIFGYFNLNLDEHLLHFLKEFGLILFVYSIGLEVGPGFFASFRNGGKQLNLLVGIVVLLGLVTTLFIYSFSGTPITTMAGILSGAVTNTPGLGAAQQAFSDLRHIDDPNIATAYAVTYPMGVLGVILSFIILRYALRIKTAHEELDARRGRGLTEDMTLNTFSVRVSNKMIDGQSIKELREVLRRDFNVTAITPADSEERTDEIFGITRIHLGDTIEIIAHPADQEAICALLGTQSTWIKSNGVISDKLSPKSMRRFTAPNLIPIMLGIVLGCVLANVPFSLPGVPVSLRLGLTGGPLVIAILIGYFGPKYKLVTHNTISSNLMIRELGISIFLACVGLGTGEAFVNTVATPTGLTWIAYGLAITMLPVLIGGLVGRYVFHINYFTLMGVLAGSQTNPPALAYTQSMTRTDAPSVGYGAVYPFAMFLRIIVIQLMIFILG